MENNKILVADDEPSIRTLYKRVIGRKGNYEVLEAANGTDAVRLYKEHLPKLVITDNNMPMQDEGLRAAAEIKKEAAEKGLEVTIAIISGTLQPKDITKQVDYLLTKPINITSLGDIVDKVYKK